MRIDQIPTTELKRILRATANAAGNDVPEVRAMQRELDRRHTAETANLSRANTDATGQGDTDAR